MGKEVVKWYRVVDPLSPLFGCDVSLDTMETHSLDGCEMVMIRSMRRVDIFVGDRPFQLIAPEGEHLGLMIDREQLDESPLQDEIVELSTTQPYGACLDEYEVERGDGLRLHIAVYEFAAQVALLSGGKLLRTQTYGSLAVPDGTRRLFEGGSPADDILEFMVVGDGEEDQ